MARFRKRRKKYTTKTTTPIQRNDSGRRSITQSLTLAANSYWLKRGFSCFSEMGLTHWGKQRADVLCMNLKTMIVLCEVKSSVADYKTDKKWHTYKIYANLCYFVMTQELFDKLKPTEYATWREHGFGVMILLNTGVDAGYLKVVVPSQKRLMKKGIKYRLICRMAWRNGISKRTNRRQRVFL